MMIIILIPWHVTLWFCCSAMLLCTLCKLPHPHPQLLPSTLSCWGGSLSFTRVDEGWKLSFALWSHLLVFIGPGLGEMLTTRALFSLSRFLVSKKRKTKTQIWEFGEAPAEGISVPGGVFPVSCFSGRICLWGISAGNHNLWWFQQVLKS